MLINLSSIPKKRTSDNKEVLTTLRALSNSQEFKFKAKKHASSEDSEE